MPGAWPSLLEGLDASADFEEVALEFDTNAATAPDQLVWCGGDCVVMAYSNIVFMVGPSGSWINFRPDSAFVVVPEMDGVRIITNTKCELLIMEQASTSASSSRAPMASERGVCQRPE